MEIDDTIQNALEILKNNSRQEKLKVGGPNFSQYYLEISKELKPLIISKIINNEITIDQGMELYKRKSTELHIKEILEELNS
jgi:hypothetical protein